MKTKNLKILLLCILCCAMFSCRTHKVSTSHHHKANTYHHVSASRSAIVDEAKRYLGSSYRYGGETPSGFDCSGFTKFVFSKFNCNLPRSSRDQYSAGKSIKTSALKAGDLVFFGGQNSYSRVGHVGIVVSADGHNAFKFIHASSHGVMIDEYPSNNYYRKRYIGARRVVD